MVAGRFPVLESINGGEGRNCLRFALAMPICRNPPPDFLSYRWRDTRTACALNQGLRSLRSLRNGSHPSLWVKGEIGMNGSGAIPGLVRLKWRRGKELNQPKTITALQRF